MELMSFLPIQALSPEMWLLLTDILLTVEVRENLKEVRNGNYQGIRELWSG